MSAIRAAIILAVVATAACGGGDSDINLEGRITDSTTQAVIVDAQITMSYRTVSQFDPGVVIERSDTAGRYRLHGREAPCEGLSVRVTASGYQPSQPVTPLCEKTVQIMDFALRP